MVAEAADGAEAIRMVPEVGPDVVLLDMRMPGQSGLDVLRELAGQDRLPPTIILTTFDDDELVPASRQAPEATCSRTWPWPNWSTRSRPSPKAGPL